MNRRSFLVGVACGLSAALAGCSALRPPQTDGPLTVSLSNEGERSYIVTATVRDAAGEVTVESEPLQLSPSSGQTVDFGRLPMAGAPYEITVDGGEWSANARWDPETCAALTVSVTIAAGGDVSTTVDCLD